MLALKLLLILLLLLLLIMLLLGECTECVLTHSSWIRHKRITWATTGRHTILHHRSKRVLPGHHLLLHHCSLILLLLEHCHLLLHVRSLVVTHGVRNELRLLRSLWLL